MALEVLSMFAISNLREHTLRIYGLQLGYLPSSKETKTHPNDRCVVANSIIDMSRIKDNIQNTLRTINTLILLELLNGIFL